MSVEISAISIMFIYLRYQLERKGMPEVSAISHRMYTPATMVGAKEFADICQVREIDKNVERKKQDNSILQPLPDRQKRTPPQRGIRSRAQRVKHPVSCGVRYNTAFPARPAALHRSPVQEQHWQNSHRPQNHHSPHHPYSCH